MKQEPTTLVRRPIWILTALPLYLALLVTACGKLPGVGPATDSPAAASGEATAWVQRAHASASAGLDLADAPAFADAKRGLIAAPSGQIKDANGKLVWDHDAFAFVKGEAPPTVNPSLWRQAKLNNHAGLFLVTESPAGRIWQVRGFDMANLTLLEGKTGYVVIDTLTARETAAAAMAFARKHLGDKPVTGVVFTHSHVDHFGGVLGVISAEEAQQRKVPIVAPAGFMEEATSENLMAGAAMARRSNYMYGSKLPRDAKGLVDTGLGKAVAHGAVGLLPPTVLIQDRTQTLTVDGVKFVFYNVPDSEAPSEMVFALPDFKAFGGSELMSHTMHNIYTIRGAKVRDALKWSGYLQASLAWVDGAEVIFNQHHWPVWGKERIGEFIRNQRDVYKFIHDQTVRHMNQGLNAAEIAERVTLPPALHKHLSIHGYYGTLAHNIKGVYQHYLGWYDANPANLNPLPPVEVAKRYTALAGGADKAVAAAQQAFDAGDLRWAAELLKHVTLAEPKHEAATALYVRTLEQLGYAAEASTWRNAYLSGAYELRQGPPKEGISLASVTEMLLHTPIERFLERMAASLDAEKAGDSKLAIKLVFTDVKESYHLQLENGVLHPHRIAPGSEPKGEVQATLSLTKPFFIRLMSGTAGAKDLLFSNETQIQGSKIDLAKFFSLIEKAPGTFPIVRR